MSDMKCPKCGGRLVYWGATGALLKCEQCKFGWGNEDLWQELIRTRKALDVAVDALKWIAYDENDEQDGLEEFAISQMAEKADDAIKTITTLTKGETDDKK